MGLQTSLRALLAQQQALDVTGHNIANANTVGYTRQEAVLSAATPLSIEGGMLQSGAGAQLGQGVDVLSYRRMRDAFLDLQYRAQNMTLGDQKTSAQALDHAQDVLGEPSDTAINALFGKFWDAWQQLANTPESGAAKAALVGHAQNLATAINQLSANLSALQSTAGQQLAQLTSATGPVQTAANEIAKLNGAIRDATLAGQQPNDLLDRRDQLVQQLSEQVGVTTSAQGNSINIFTGNGQTLVSGSTALALKAAPDPYDPTRVNVVSQTGATLDGQLQGGSLGGLLDYRSSVLEPARNQLGRVAIAFANTINAQHRQGMDLNGQLGGDLFSLPAPQAFPADGNAGNATMTASVTDVGALTSSDYILRFDGSEWKATTTGGNPVVVTGSPTGPLEFDGLKLEIAGTASAGDTFKVEPTRAAAGDIALAVSDPNQLALAAPFKITAADANQAVAGAVKITDAGNPAVLQPVSIEFTSGSTYSVNGTGSYSYSAGSPIEVNGWSLALNGTPATGDRFTIKSNSDGVGDNSNALALGETADLGVLAGGTASAGAAYASLIADTGTTGAQAQVNLASQTSLFQQAQQSQQSVAGVNLDEEAGNLIKYQQSYQAAAQVISTANTIFNTLISAVRS